MEEQTITVREVGKAAQRALEYQRYVFRRAYGFYYLVWAVAMILEGSTNLAALLHLGGELGGAVDLGVLLVILFAALGATAGIFSRARRAIRLRKALRGGKDRNHAPYFVAWFLAVLGIILAADFLAPGYSQVALYLVALPVAPFLYFILGIAFPDGRPVEGMLALAAYGTATSLGLVLSAARVELWLVPWVWAAMATIWFLASFYAFFRAPGELEALRS